MITRMFAGNHNGERDLQKDHVVVYKHNIYFLNHSEHFSNFPCTRARYLLNHKKYKANSTNRERSVEILDGEWSQYFLYIYSVCL